MIFSIEGHVAMIMAGFKTETRRKSNAYLIGKTYSIQPGRKKKGISEGRILIIDKQVEASLFHRISEEDAKSEGGYTPTEFEELYEKIDPSWEERYVYKFKFVPSSSREAN